MILDAKILVVKILHAKMLDVKIWDANFECNFPNSLANFKSALQMVISLMDLNDGPNVLQFVQLYLVLCVNDEQEKVSYVHYIYF